MRPHFQREGQKALKFNKKLVFVGLRHTKVSAPFSLTTILTSKNDKEETPVSLVNLILVCCEFRV